MYRKTRCNKYYNYYFSSFVGFTVTVNLHIYYNTSILSLFLNYLYRSRLLYLLELTFSFSYVSRIKVTIFQVFIRTDLSCKKSLCLYHFGSPLPSLTVCVFKVHRRDLLVPTSMLVPLRVSLKTTIKIQEVNLTKNHVPTSNFERRNTE